MNIENRRPFQELSAVSGDVAAVTWSNLLESLNAKECGVN